MVEHVTDLIFVEMEVRVEDFDLVVEISIKVEGFDLELAVDFVADFLREDSSHKMEDIDNIEQISHKDFVPFVPRVEIDTEIEAKVATKNSSLVGAENTLDC